MTYQPYKLIFLKNMESHNVVTELTYNNLDDLFNDVVGIKGKLRNEFIECSANDTYNRYVFRGEASSHNELIPSALRIVNEKKLCYLSGYISPRKGIKNAMDQINCEELLLRKFYSKCDDNGLKIPRIKRLRYHNISNLLNSYDHRWIPDDYFELAGLAQHYGLPTRLLDWSFNFFIALYFALLNSKKNIEYCSVWAFAYSMIGNYFVNRQDKLIVIVPEYSQNPNLMAQKGVFTHWQIGKYTNQLENNPVDRRPLPELFSSQIRTNETDDFSKLFYKINIPLKFKKELIVFLSTLGIDASTLFPGYDGITRSIKENGKIINMYIKSRK